MPYTVNGTGTWYYGKKDLHVHHDVCGHCGAEASLSSYSTTKYLVLFFLPILPLGRVRVMNDCSACRKHLAMKLSKWRAAREETVREASAALGSNRTDAGKAAAFIQACASYQDADSFDRLASQIEKDLSENAQVQALLGWAYEYFGRPGKAEQAYRISLHLEDDPDVRESLGVLLIRQGRPADARTFLWHIVDRGSAESVATVLYLVEGLQSQGLHHDAAQILDEISRAFPEIEKNKQFKKYRKTVRRYAGTDRRVGARRFPPGRAARSGADWSGRIAPVLWVTLLVCGVGFLAYVGLQSTQSHAVYLVNGWDRSYEVVLDGSRYTLFPNRPLEVRVSQRKDLLVEVAVEGASIEAVPLRIEIPLWTSLFGDRTYVVNPDRTAVILWEQTEYAEHPVAKNHPYAVHLGKAVHVFENVDYSFREFPAEIPLPSGTSRVEKERVSLLPDMEPVQAYLLVMEGPGRAAALEYLEQCARLNPADTATLRFLAGASPAEDFAALARPQLETRPLIMEWHRAYQTVMERAGVSQQLREEYRSLLERDSENPDLMYLYARVLEDPGKSEEWLERASQGDPPSAYALNALAYQRLTEGEPRSALPYIGRAREVDPENPNFVHVENEILLALGHYDELLSRNRELQDQDPSNGELVAEEIRLSVASGRHQTARESMESYLGRLTTEGEDREQWQRYLEAAYRLGVGDLQGFGAHISSVEGARWAYQAALARGDFETAIRALSDAGENTAVDHMLVYLAATGAGETGKSEWAERQLLAAIELWNEGALEERIAAECLAGKRPPSAALRLTLDPESKAVSLAVLAKRFRDGRCLELARKLNYHLSFRRHYLARFLD